jgi:mono/diheme cytochrome c family protein
MFRGEMIRSRQRLRPLRGAAAIVVLLAVTGCYQKMGTQPAHRPYDRSEFFVNQSSARMPVAGTIARGQLREDTHLYTGKIGEQVVNSFPFPVTAELLDRGEERYNIYCSVCHGFGGDGDGMIPARGYRRPPSFHTADQQGRTLGHYYDVITNGFGAMPHYRTQVGVEDRWAIVAYVRALQMSRRATTADVPPEEMTRLAAEATR